MFKNVFNIPLLTYLSFLPLSLPHLLNRHREKTSVDISFHTVKPRYTSRTHFCDNYI